MPVVNVSDDVTVDCATRLPTVTTLYMYRLLHWHHQLRLELLEWSGLYSRICFGVSE